MTEQTEDIVLTAEFLVNPYPTYDRLRAEQPVHKVGMMGSDVKVWLVTRWDITRDMLTDPRLSKSASKAGFSLEDTRMPMYAPENAPLRHHMINADPPEHAHLRQPVQKILTTGRVQKLESWIQQVTDELIDRIAPLGRVELVADVARSLPVFVICELMGIPEKDRGELKRWSRAVVAAPAAGAEYQQLAATLREVYEYLTRLIASKRSEPDDGLISSLIDVWDNDSGELHLTEHALLSTVFLLLFAGQENTSDMIGNGMLALMRHPEKMAQLRGDPSLLTTAVDEFLRYDSPGNITTWRFALESIEVEQVVIRRGEPLLIAMPAANRDPERFPDPHNLDLQRSDNPHISFGHGIHKCLGAHLARMQGRIAIGTLLRRLPDIQLAVAPSELRYKPSILVRGLEELPITFTPTSPGPAESSA